MSQFTPRVQSTPSQFQGREQEARLRGPSEAYPQKDSGSIHAQQPEETQKIKNLSFWENTDQEASDENEWAERQSPTPFILAIIILVVASALLWFLFQWASSENTNTPLIIPADTAPFKVRPENPGGMMIPHQDKLIYGRLSPNTPQPIERLLPPPEQPMAAPLYQPPLEGAPVQQQFAPPPSHYSYPPQGQVYGPSQPGYGPPPPFQQPAQQPSFQQVSPQPYPSSQGQAPYAQQHPLPNQPVFSPPPPSPYGPPAFLSTVQPPLAPPAAPLDLATPKLSTVENIKPAAEEDVEEEDVISREGHNELDQLIAKEAQTPLRRSFKKNAEKPVKPVALDPAKYKVQIASLPSRSMAEQEMKRLRASHRSVFENRPWNIQRINAGPDRNFIHRLVIGSFPNQNAAIKFCKRLKSEKIGCRVVAPVNE